MGVRTVKCVNDSCSQFDVECEIARLAQVAPGVGIQIIPMCATCEWAMFTVDNRVAQLRLTKWQAEHVAMKLRGDEGGMDPLDAQRVADVLQQIQQALDRSTP